MKTQYLLILTFLFVSCGTPKKKEVPDITEFKRQLSSFNSRIVGKLKIKDYKGKLNTLTYVDYLVIFKIQSKADEREAQKYVDSANESYLWANKQGFFVCLKSIEYQFLLCDDSQKSGVESVERDTNKGFNSFVDNFKKEYHK